MRTVLATFALSIIFASPAAAEWTITAETATWHAEKDLAVVTQARDAILWQRSQEPLFGAILTAALPNLSVTDLSNGQGRVEIVMARAAFDTWAAALVAEICPGAVTNADKLACSDAGIKASFKQVMYRHQLWLREQSNPIPETPEL